MGSDIWKKSVKDQKRWITSIIPVWTAETIRGWTGRRNADAAIKNFGLSSLRALDRHWQNVYQFSVLWTSEQLKELEEKCELVELIVCKKQKKKLIMCDVCIHICACINYISFQGSMCIGKLSQFLHFS